MTWSAGLRTPAGPRFGAWVQIMVVEAVDGELEHLAIEEQQRAEGLILGRRAHAALDGAALRLGPGGDRPHDAASDYSHPRDARKLRAVPGIR